MDEITKVDGDRLLEWYWDYLDNNYPDSTDIKLLEKLLQREPNNTEIQHAIDRTKQEMNSIPI